MVWMKLLELPYFEFNRKYHAHGKFLLNHFFQKQLIHDTNGCKVNVYGFGNFTSLLCDP
jgi:hypothetical protein